MSESETPRYRPYGSYREIPGVTQAEISAIEALKQQYAFFTYGAVFSIEAFYKDDHLQNMQGYTARLCQWLSKLFGISFVPRIYAWDELRTGLADKTVHFTGELTPLEAGDQFFKTNPIVDRVYRSFRIQGKADWFVNKELERPENPRYGFLEGTLALERLAPFLGEARFVQIQSDLEAYERLQKGDIDVFFDEDAVVSFFDQFPNVVADYYYPQVHSVVCIASQIPELAPVISVIQKYVEQGAYTHLADLYNLGQQDYQQYKFWIKLTDQEKAYIYLHRDPEQAIKIGLQYDNYPLSFYNAQERQWQGIVPDLLQRMHVLTGLEFLIANKPNEIRSSLLDMLEQGAVSMMGQLLYTENREGRFIWADEPYVKDRYALLSRDDFPDVAINKLINERVGIVDESVYTEVFPDWFSRGRHFNIYPTFAEAFDALEKREINLLMSSSNSLLMLTSYYERIHFKVNYTFDLPYNTQFGFNKEETTLRGIIAKAQSLINTEVISNRWSRRIFNYQGRRAQAQIPYLIGVCMVLMIALVVILLLRNKQMKGHVSAADALVHIIQERTRELEKQTLLAQAANKAKGQFLANMSHEIRTPMNAIIGMSDLMRTDNFDQVQIDYFNDVKNMAKSLLQIMNDILDFSKIEAGKLVLEPVDFNILGLYDNICSLSMFSAKTKDLEFRYHFDKNIPEILYADQERIRQIILNIISNAIKYTKAGYVSFKLDRVNQNEKDWVCCRVEDSGIGIKEENFPRVFGPFEQFDKEKNAGTTGTGLGLSITKRLIEMMGGTIAFHSEYGKGTVFTVHFPLVEGDRSKIEQVGSLGRVLAREDRGVQVLVVDDNSINLSVAVGFLATHRIRADTALSGQIAIEKVQEKQYDLVFMDHMMPGIDGVETTQAIRNLPEARFKNMPIVALSANAISGARETFLAAGMNDFISKPIMAEELNIILKKWLPRDKIMVAADLVQKRKYQDEDQPEDSVQGMSIESREFSALLAELAKIEGFDTKTGLFHIGNNTKAYIGVLRQFYTKCDKYLTEIRQYLAAEDWKNYSIKLHALKGIFATIGMDFLSQWAYKLEMASKNGDLDTCKTETEDICQAIYLFTEGLRRTSLSDVEEPVEKTLVEPGLLKEKLDALMEACKQGDCDTADVLTAELTQMSLNDETDLVLTEICTLAESLDYVEVIKKIKELQTALG